MSNRQHLEVYAGVNQTLTLTGRTPTNGTLSLTGKTVTWYVGRDPLTPDDTAALFTKSGTVTGASTGVFTVPVTPSDTEDLSGDYEHMAKSTDGSGNVAVIVQGRFRIKPSLTT